MTIHLFVYGSMMIPSSAASALGRTIGRDDMVDAVLPGFARVWRAHSPIIAVREDREVDGVFYDIAEYTERFVNGVLFELNENELENVRLREKQYDLIDVTGAVFAVIDPGKTFSVISKVECRASRPGFDAVIPLKYAKRVDDEARERGSRFHRNFISSTVEASYPGVPGDYRFVDEGQASRV